MRRRDYFSLFGAVILIGPLFAHAQSARKVHRIGYVAMTRSGGSALDAFSEGLRQAGYVVGQTLLIEKRFAAGRAEILPTLVAELLDKKVDVLVAGSPPAALAARSASIATPIVFAGVIDPVGSGLVANLARPGGNVTGATVGTGDEGFTSKSVQLFKELVPGINRMAVIINPVSHPQFIHEIELAARRLSITLEMHEVRGAADLEKVLALVSQTGVQALFVGPDPFLTDNSSTIADAAVARRLPAFHFSRRFVDAGGLVSFGGSLDDSYRRAAAYVDKILKGAKPADLPVDQPNRFELVINLKTAKAIGLVVPATLLNRADDVVE